MHQDVTHTSRWPRLLWGMFSMQLSSCPGVTLISHKLLQAGLTYCTTGRCWDFRVMKLSAAKNILCVKSIRNREAAPRYDFYLRVATTEKRSWTWMELDLLCSWMPSVWHNFFHRLHWAPLTSFLLLFPQVCSEGGSFRAFTKHPWTTTLAKRHTTRTTTNRLTSTSSLQRCTTSLQRCTTRRPHPLLYSQDGPNSSQV